MRPTACTSSPTTRSSVSGAHQQIFEGNISGSGGLTAIYTTPDTNGPDFLGGMVYNPANHKLTFVVDDNTAPHRPFARTWASRSTPASSR